MNENELFPLFMDFYLKSSILKNVKGALAAQLPRIIGMGNTKAIGMNLPPADIERKQELINIKFPENLVIPANVKSEIDIVRTEFEKEYKEIASEQGARRLSSRVIEKLNGGCKNNCYYAGNFLLFPDNKNFTYSWGITRYHEIISKIPPDIDYLIKAYEQAEIYISAISLSTKNFEKKLILAYSIASSLSENKDNILIKDVARFFRISMQEPKFWINPDRKNYKDYPEAAFIYNLIKWKTTSEQNLKVELVPAVINQAMKSNPLTYFIPVDKEGTQVRPYIYIKISNY